VTEIVFPPAPRKLLRALGAGVCIAAAFAPSLARSDQLEEIVVTAQKRAQLQEDVGISMTALTGDQIRAMNFHDLADVAKQTPSLSVASPLGSSGNQNFTLRGVGLNDFSEHNESPVATYQDGVYQATIAGVNSQLFDVDRIEVLRGPQGTLYGRNTTGGLVQFVSKQPTATADGFAEVQVASHDETRFEGAMGGPLTDSLQGRASLLYDHYDGWGVSTYPGVKAANGDNMLAARTLLKYMASDDTSILFNVHAGTNHTTGPQYKPFSTMYAPDGVTQIATPANVINPTCANVFGLQGRGQDCFGYRDTNPNPWVTDNNRQPFQKLDTNGASVTVESKFGSTSFTSISAYERVHKLYGEDTDGGPIPAIAVTNPVESKELTQEFRLAGKTEKAYWTTGLYYFYRDISAGSDTNVSGVGFVDDAFSDRLRSKSAAAFGQLEYDLTSHFTAIGGLRFSHEDQNFSLLSVDRTGLTPVFLGITPNPVPNYNVFPFTGGTTADPTPYRDARTDNLVTFRTELDWKPTKDLLVYGSTSKGTKSAGWNGAIDGSPLLGPSTEQDMAYGPEKLLAYEMGFKKSVKGLFHLNASVFYYDYKDFQAFTFSGLVQQIANRPAAVKGGEVEFVVTPTEHLDLTLGGSRLESEVKNVTTAVAGAASLETVTRDRHMVLAPDFSLNAMVRYHLPVLTNKELAFQVDSVYTGKQYFDLDNDPIATERGHAVTDVSISLAAPAQGWTVSIWSRNVFDRAYRMYAIPVTSLGFTQQMYGPPRWVGATLSYKW